MNIRISLVGTSPLLCHNDQLADPDNAFVKQMAIINKKKNNKTEDDRAAVAKLEWYGGLYTSPDILGPVIPTKNIIKCIRDAGTITRKGKDVKRALSVDQLYIPLSYEGPRDIDALFQDSRFHDRQMVKVGAARIPRTRPRFTNWALVADLYLTESLMDFDELVRIVEFAGLAEGLGDNRTNGYGRFEAKVSRR